MSLHTLASVASHIQNVTRVNLAVTAIPFSRLNLAVCHHLYQQGFITSVKNGSITGPDETPVDVTPDNIAKRRIWVGLKYRDTGSVITKFSLISKPAQRMKFTSQQIREFAAGKSVRNVKPVQPDELVLVRPHRSKDVLELSEAAHRNLAAELLCRVR